MEVDACGGELRLVLRQLGPRLLELHLKGPRIDFGQQIPLIDELSFAEQHAHQLAVDARAHGNGVEGGHRPERVSLLPPRP